MALLGKLLARYGNSNVHGFVDRVVDTTADVAANATTDRTFSETIGRKADAVVTTVGVVASIVAMLKGLLNLLNGTTTRIGQPFTLDKTLASIATAGTAVATATGSIYVEKISIQKITAGQADVACTAITMTTDDTVPLNQLLLDSAGQPMDDSDFAAVGARYTYPVNHTIATTKVLKLVATGANLANASYRVQVQGWYASQGASVA